VPEVLDRIINHPFGRNLASRCDLAAASRRWASYVEVGDSIHFESTPGARASVMTEFVFLVVLCQLTPKRHRHYPESMNQLLSFGTERLCLLEDDGLGQVDNCEQSTYERVRGSNPHDELPLQHLQKVPSGTPFHL
jgi:hypothetical protein